ncbi:hypothetical protein [Prescottella agglutinans]|uniref:hypothetical protein n=1 Tax=Prescottella agglutinans TaxID=1644129 RepID=UPI003D99FCDF
MYVPDDPIEREDQHSSGNREQTAAAPTLPDRCQDAESETRTYHEEQEGEHQEPRHTHNVQDLSSPAGRTTIKSSGDRPDEGRRHLEDAAQVTVDTRVNRRSGEVGYS